MLVNRQFKTYHYKTELKNKNISKNKYLKYFIIILISLKNEKDQAYLQRNWLNIGEVEPHCLIPSKSTARIFKARI